MTSHLENAEKEIQLARLLSERRDTRDEDVREEIRERIEIARAELGIAENELDRMASFQGTEKGDK